MVKIKRSFPAPSSLAEEAKRNGKYPDRKFDWENLFWS